MGQAAAPCKRHACTIPYIVHISTKTRAARSRARRRAATHRTPHRAHPTLRFVCFFEKEKQITCLGAHEALYMCVMAPPPAVSFLAVHGCPSPPLFSLLPLAFPLPLCAYSSRQALFPLRSHPPTKPSHRHHSASSHSRLGQGPRAGRPLGCPRRAPYSPTASLSLSLLWCCTLPSLLSLL